MNSFAFYDDLPIQRRTMRFCAGGGAGMSGSSPTGAPPGGAGIGGLGPNPGFNMADAMSQLAVNLTQGGWYTGGGGGKGGSGYEPKGYNKGAETAFRALQYNPLTKTGQGYNQYGKYAYDITGGISPVSGRSPYSSSMIIGKPGQLTVNYPGAGTPNFWGDAPSSTGTWGVPSPGWGVRPQGSLYGVATGYSPQKYTGQAGGDQSATFNTYGKNQGPIGNIFSSLSQSWNNLINSIGLTNVAGEGLGFTPAKNVNFASEGITTSQAPGLPGQPPSPNNLNLMTGTRYSPFKATSADEAAAAYLRNPAWGDISSLPVDVQNYLSSPYFAEISPEAIAAAVSILKAVHTPMIGAEGQDTKDQTVIRALQSLGNNPEALAELSSALDGRGLAQVIETVTRGVDRPFAANGVILTRWGTTITVDPSRAYTINIMSVTPQEGDLLRAAGLSDLGRNEIQAVKDYAYYTYGIPIGLDASTVLHYEGMIVDPGKFWNRMDDYGRGDWSEVDSDPFGQFLYNAGITTKEAILNAANIAWDAAKKTQVLNERAVWTKTNSLVPISIDILGITAYMNTSQIQTAIQQMAAIVNDIQTMEAHRRTGNGQLQLNPITDASGNIVGYRVQWGLNPFAYNIQGRNLFGSSVAKANDKQTLQNLYQSYKEAGGTLSYEDWYKLYLETQRTKLKSATTSTSGKQRKIRVRSISH